MMPSPLKDKPLRNPGQSLDEELIDLAFDFLGYITVVLIFFMIMLMQWYSYWTSSPPTPLPWTVLFVISLIVSVCKIRPKISKLNNIKQGRDGEKAVGQYLENLRHEGAKIFHDIRGDNFNVDHVVIAPTGIFVIETKTWSKSDGEKNEITFDGKTFKKNDFAINPSPTIQASACAKYIQELLLESTGRKFAIQPVVTFPGWHTKHDASFDNYVPWVLNPKALVTFILKAKNPLSPEDVKLAAFHLSRFIRVVESQPKA